MPTLRWYTAQLDALPERSRRQLAQQLRRAAQRGDLPSRRAWRYAVQKAARFS